MRKIGGVDWSTVNETHELFFITLTYPNEYPTARASKKHLENFRSRLLYRFPHAFGFWKIEPQKRGAPHYHFVLAMPISIKTTRSGNELWTRLWEFVPMAWCGVVGSDDPKHLEFHINPKNRVVERVKSPRGVMAYCAKYVSKETESDWENGGRWWGYVNKKKVKEFVYGRAWQVSRKAFYLARRLYRKLAPVQVQKSRAATSQGTWYTFERDHKDAWGGKLLARVLIYALGIEGKKPPPGPLEEFAEFV